MAGGQPDSGAAGVPQDFGEHIRLMCDLMVLAFQTDLTRIATLHVRQRRQQPQLSLSRRPRRPPRPVAPRQGRDKQQQKIAKINRFHIEQLAYMLDKMASVKEGDGTLLDNWS